MPLYIVWTNLHGGVLGGIGTVGLTDGGLDRLSPAQPAIADPDDSPFRPGGRHRGGLLGTVLVNPYGVETIREWLALMGSDALSRLIVEHGPLDPSKPDGMMVIAAGPGLPDRAGGDLAALAAG